MLDLLTGLLYFAGIAVMAALTTDIAITAYHRAHGTPTARKVYEKMIQTHERIIKAQKVTIRAQQSEIWIHKKRVEDLELKLWELEHESRPKNGE